MVSLGAVDCVAGIGIFKKNLGIFKKKKKVVAVPPEPVVEVLATLQAGPLAYWPAPQVLPPRPDPAKVLMVEVNAAYQSGLEAYQAGHLVKAKAEFDRAVDLILQSGLDINSHPPLQKELEKIVDNVHRMEQAALKEGDGFTERRPVLAAIDEVADVTFPVDPKIKEKVEREVKDTASDFPLVINDYVLGYINHFSGKGKATIANGWRRAGRYREMIQRIFREEGVPQDLIYLAQAESSFQELALSRAGARGMWQFMAGTGRAYGLERNWWVDLRQDAQKATRAAAQHLRDLYAMFGDWYLAMAAYNSGPQNVKRAIERTGYADFWQLYKRNVLPRETRNYVPIILAVTIMSKHPEQYGLSEVLPDPPIETETVMLRTPTDLRLIAETIDCRVELLQELNPSLLRWVTPKEEFELRLPAGSRDRFLERIAMIPEDKRVWWHWHRVAEGETLGEIAKSFKTTTRAISEVNNLAANEPLQAGANLVIPVTPKNNSLTAAASSGIKMVSLRYRVRSRDTLTRVADKFGVTPNEVMEWNRLTTNTLQPGRMLTIRTTQSDYLKMHPQRKAPAKGKPPSTSAKKSNTAAPRPATGNPRGTTIAAAPAFQR